MQLLVDLAARLDVQYNYQFVQHSVVICLDSVYSNKWLPGFDRLYNIVVSSI